MSEIQIVTDSTAYFTKEEIEQYDIKVVPLSVNFLGEESLEGLPGEFEEFYKKLEETKEFPTTSQPASIAFQGVFKEAIDQGKEVIAILISSKLSGTYNSALIGAQMTDSDEISVIDSMTSVGNLKYLAIKAHKLSQEGKTRQEIVEDIEEQKTRLDTYLTVDTIEYLRRGGRLSNAQAFIASILNIKPIIQLKDGKLEGIAKTRGKKKAMDMMINKIPEEVKNIYVQHAVNEKEAKEVQAILKEKYPNVEILIEELGPVIGTHLGPKAIGVVYNW